MDVDKKMERNIIWTLAIILILIGLFGCAKPQIDADGQKKPVTITESISNMGAIGDILGCMFAPNNPYCDKHKELKNQSPEEDRQNVPASTDGAA